jgi:SAM-dependent methyltransferase
VSDYIAANRAIWNAWTTHFATSAHHTDAALVRAGGSSLRSIEREEVGAVPGRTLLHLQCNLGADTLSWARLGAQVTGVDIAENAIGAARTLARETELPARFLQSDVYALPAVLEDEFDIVFASYGVLCWLPDLPRWAEIAARYVRPGGVFYLVDMHPFTNVFAAADTTGSGLDLRVARPYFHAAAPAAEEVEHTGAGNPTTLYSWSYGLGEVVSALLAAGLRLDFLHEHAVTCYQRFQALVRGDDGWWRWPSPEHTLPLLFSLRATK